MSTFTERPSTSGLYMPGSPARQLMSQEYAASRSFLESSIDSIEEYARKEPWGFAAWAFGIGFVIGWKLKPW